MKFYVVGGACRDFALKRAPRDVDFLVVGATYQDMIDMGYIPIEATSFPVFHYPVTKAEFALARRESKVGPGYHGFEVETENLNPELLEKFIALGYDPEQSYDVEELIQVFQQINQ
ncbi:MAG: hypothetical protein QXN55_00550 [Candidatus Nitrosotenuis sp.]